MIVHQCPLNKIDWDTASQKLQCVVPNSYHCLRTEDGGETEQCLGKVWIQERMCPEYNSKVDKIDVFSCQNSQGCPLGIYWSDEVYKYPACSEKKSLETTTTPSIDGVSGKDYTVLYITVVSSILFVITLVIVTIWLIKRRRQRTRQRNTRDEDRQTPDLTEPLTSSDILRRVQQTPGRSPLTDNGNPYEYRFPREPSPLNDTRNANRLFPLTANVAKPEPEIYQGISDIEDLKKHGVLVFISNDEGEMGQRMRSIADSGEFGASRYEHSLNLWDAEDDISLYLFRQPIEDMSSLVERSDKLIDMYRRVKQTPKTYFVLYFGKNEWGRYQNKLIEFDFFKIAKRKMI